MRRVKNRPFIAASVLIIFLFAALSYLFPYSGDDWAWGSIDGVMRLKSFFDAYNGRYSGNLLVLVLTRVPLLKTIVMALSYYLVALIACKYSSSRRTSALFLGTLLFLTMSKNIFVQAVVWTSGYSNYVPPIIMIMAYMLMIKDIFKEETPAFRKSLSVPAFLLGFVGAMFMENITLYSLFAGAAVIAYCLVKFKRVYFVQISYFVGALLGTVLMFSNSSYRMIASGEDTYRSVNSDASGLLDTFIEHSDEIYNGLFVSNRIILVVLSVLLVLLCIIRVEKAEKKSIKAIALISTAVNIGTLIILVFKSDFSHWQIGIFSSRKELITVVFFSIISAIYYLSLSVSMLACLESREEQHKAGFLIISIPVIVAPLFVVNPIGPRNFFPPFMLMLIIAVMLYENVLKHLSLKTVSKVLALLFSAAIMASAVHLFSIYIPVYVHNQHRLEWIMEQTEDSKSVKFSKLPYPSYTHMGDPPNELFEERFKNFYGIDSDVEFEYVSYKKLK